MNNNDIMLEKNFSNKVNLDYIECVKSLFSNLGIELSEQEATLELSQLLKLKSVKVYNYRKEIRKYIGQTPLLHCGANCILYCKKPNGDIAILVQNRNDLTEGKYSFCGGGQEIYIYKDNYALESTLLTAYREVKEETGFSINHINLILYFDYSSFIQYQDGNKILASSNFYIAEVPYLELLEMSHTTCKEEYNDELYHMTHSLVNISNINEQFIADFAPNHRPALIKFLREFIV